MKILKPGRLKMRRGCARDRRNKRAYVQVKAEALVSLGFRIHGGVRIADWSGIGMIPPLVGGVFLENDDNE